MAKDDSGSPAIAVLKEEIAAIEKAQEPTRRQVAALEAELVEGQQIIARNNAAIDVLNGNVAVASGTRRRRGASGSINEDRVVGFVAANQPVGAAAIGQAVGASGNALSVALKRMVDAGTLSKTGERRGTRYSVKMGG